VTFGKTRGAGVDGRYHVTYQYEQEDVGLEAGRLGITLLHSLLPPELQPEGSVPGDFDFAAERDEFIRFAQRRALGPSTMSLVRAAEDRRIPWIRLNEQSLIQFGHGRFQQRIQATITSRTSHIAVELASDKEETNRILGDLGLPVPQQRQARTAEDAATAAARLGFPVVVKPLDANHGRGVSLDLKTGDDVRVAVVCGSAATGLALRRVACQRIHAAGSVRPNRKPCIPKPQRRYFHAKSAL
jgi:cyanophycin synthetase